MTGGFKPRIWYDRRTAAWIAAVPAVREQPSRVSGHATWHGAVRSVARFYWDAAAPTSGGSVFVPGVTGGQLWNAAVSLSATEVSALTVRELKDAAMRRLENERRQQEQQIRVQGPVTITGEVPAGDLADEIRRRFASDLESRGFRRLPGERDRFRRGWTA